MIKLEAHRGVSKRYPENTMSAFEAAANEGYNMIELDMCFSRDDKCLILHDSTINRTARRRDGSAIEKEIKVSELTYSELCELDFGCWMGEEFKGERIPTLAEVLRFADEKNIPLKFDNKLQRFDKEKQNLFFDEIERYGKLVGGFSVTETDFAKRVIERFPSCDIHCDGVIYEEVLRKVSGMLKNNTLTVWLPIKIMSWLDFPPADRTMAELVRKYGKVGLWIVTDADELDRCLQIGADIIETDGTVTPEMLRRMSDV